MTPGDDHKVSTCPYCGNYCGGGCRPGRIRPRLGAVLAAAGLVALSACGGLPTPAEAQPALDDPPRAQAAMPALAWRITNGPTAGTDVWVACTPAGTRLVVLRAQTGGYGSIAAYPDGYCPGRTRTVLDPTPEW